MLVTQDRQQQEDKQTKEEEQGEGKFAVEGQEGEHKMVLPPAGKEYTYLVSGWDRPTDVPILQTEDKNSGVESILLLLVFVLLVIGEEKCQIILRLYYPYS